jgi:hypothetical protein
VKSAAGGTRWVARPWTQVWFNGICTLIWAVLLPVPFIGGWSLFSTVKWVSFVSIWALFATHLGAWIAALVNVRAEDIQMVASYQQLKAILHAQDAMLVELHALAIDTDETLDEIEEHFHGDTLSQIKQRAREAGYDDGTP